MKNRYFKNVIAGILSAAMLTCMLAGCSSTNESVNNEGTSASVESGAEVASVSEVVSVDFWSAPEQFNLDFWSNYAAKFNAANIQIDGKVIQVNVQMMPAQPSSEAGIQNAIATGTVPAISENINRSFANILATSEAVYDMSGEAWFKEILAERHIESTIEGWAIDGAQYVLPLYVNPITLCYNSKALSILGFDNVPQTAADLEALLAAYKENKSDLGAAGITHFMYRAELLNSANYWERWFDIEAPYNAFAQGTPLVDGNKLTADADALEKVFTMYADMGDSLLTGTIDGFWQSETIPAVMGIGLPWEISGTEAAGKTYGLNGDYVFGPTVVENAGDTHYNYADSKGIVLYKNNAISEEEHKGAVEFLKYVFLGEGKDTFDVDWLNTTSMLPVRGDLATNDAVFAYFEDHAALKDIASYVADAIPGMAHEKGADIMTALGEAIIPMVNEITSNGNPDIAAYVDAAMKAMKEAGGLE